MKKTKNLLTVLTVLVISQIIFSCKTTTVDIVKRHYRHGYYVNIGTDEKGKKYAVNYEGKEKIVPDTMTVGKVDVKLNSETISEDSDVNLSASTNNEILLVKNEPKYFDINVLKKCISNNKPSENCMNKEKITKRSMANPGSSAMKDHNRTRKILEIVGIIIGIIGILIYLSAFPADMAGMALGRILLGTGILTWFIGIFF